MKKRRILAVVLAACLVFAGGAWAYNEYVRTQNVFDQMYHTRMDSLWQRATFFAREVYYGGMFSNMEQAESYSDVESGIFYISYRDECLDPDTSLRLTFFPEGSAAENDLYITYWVGAVDDEDRKWYSYAYDLADQTLTYTSNDPGNAEGKAFLYDTLLANWFEANPHTRFSLDDLGKYTFIDETG